MKEMFKRTKILLMCLVCMLVLTGLYTEPVMAASKKSITLNQKNATIEVGKTTKIKVKKVKGLKSKKVTYKSSNKKVATVNKNGVVTGKKNGSATITVTSKENKKVKAKFKVKVVTDFFKANKANIRKVGTTYTQEGLFYSYGEEFMYEGETSVKYGYLGTCDWDDDYNIVRVEVTTKTPKINGAASIRWQYNVYDLSGKTVTVLQEGDLFKQKSETQMSFNTYWEGLDNKNNDYAYFVINYVFLLEKNEAVYLLHGGYDSIEHYQNEIAEGFNKKIKKGQQLKVEDLHKSHSFFKVSVNDAKKALKK